MGHRAAPAGCGQKICLHLPAVVKEAMLAKAHRRVATQNNSTFQKARDDVGLSKVRVHDLRHTYGQRLRDAGVSQQDRALLLGHAGQRNAAALRRCDGGQAARLACRNRVHRAELHVTRANHVVRHEQNLRPSIHGAAPPHGQLRNPSRMGIARQQPVQHGHKVVKWLLPDPNEPCKYAALLTRLHRLLVESQRIPESICQLLRHDIVITASCPPRQRPT